MCREHREFKQSLRQSREVGWLFYKSDLWPAGSLIRLPLLGVAGVGTTSIADNSFRSHSILALARSVAVMSAILRSVDDFRSSTHLHTANLVVNLLSLG